MKSYTDLEQSKKLAEILPIESADGYWFRGFPIQPYMVYTAGTPNPGRHIPCWSLFALLKVIGNNLKYSLNYNGILFTLTVGDFEVSNKTIIDACVEMILKLNELKML